MTDIPQTDLTGPKEWSITLPDWGLVDTVWNRDLPFALWTIGEQELLFHWLDAAVDQGSEKVILYVADRPVEIRQAISNALLWPIEIEVRSVSNIDEVEADDVANRLPNSPPLKKQPKDGWELILYWHALEQEWLQVFSADTKRFGDYVAIGKYCEIAADTKFIKPYWIGDFVNIGPGSKIGPNVVIESGCIIAGNSNIENAHLGPNTYLGPETDLIEAAIERNELISFKNRAYVNGLEALIANDLSGNKEIKKTKPSLRDRLTALRLYLRWRHLGYTSETTFTDINGLIWPLLSNQKTQARGPWLKLVIRGKLSLFGITPRPESALKKLPIEWQTILRKAGQGAFSYADVMGANDIGTEEEALHCVYQASIDDEHCRNIFKNWLEQLK